MREIRGEGGLYCHSFLGGAPSVLPSASRADPVTVTGPGRGSATDSVTVTGPDLTGASASAPSDEPGVTSVSESVAVTDRLNQGYRKMPHI